MGERSSRGSIAHGTAAGRIARAIEAADATGAASARAGQTGPDARWIGRNDPPGLPQEVQIRIAVLGAEARGGSRVPASRAPTAVDSPHSGNPPGGAGGSSRLNMINIGHATLKPSGGPSLTTFACALNGRARSSIGTALRVRDPGRTESAVGPGAPRKESVHNRFAGRPEPMAWRPSGETRFMGWTVNTQPPHGTACAIGLTSKNLDDRCLLSTGWASISTDVTATAASVAAGIDLGTRHHGRHAGRRGPQLVVRHHAATAAQSSSGRPARSRPAPATAYDPIIGAAQARSTYNVNGSGMTVAVIDTGVDYNNPALGGGFGPGDKVIAGYDFADDSANPMATTSQHGTAVAGLIGSDDPNDLGVAPGVNIVALQGHRRHQHGQPDQRRQALQWVINNHAEYNITAVNMSLSDGGNYAQNWFADDGGAAEQVTNLIGQLAAMNIPVIAATGNNFTGQQGKGSRRSSPARSA